jgi:hypothetical protein
MVWMHQLSEALDYAHERKVLHRDIKPANILLDADRDVHLADFGIACLTRDIETRVSGAMTIGTLMFMSPEQLMGESLDARSDVYSLGSTLYELLNGRPPFHSGSIVTQIQMKPVDAIPSLPEEMNAVLSKALAKNRDDRYASCGAFCLAFAHAVRRMAAAANPAAAPVVLAQPNRARTPDSKTVVLRTQPVESQPQRLGGLLVDAGVISREQLETALELQKGTRDRVGAILVAQGFVDETAIARALERQLEIPFVSLRGEEFEREVTELITGRIAEHRKCIPVRRSGDRVIVAMSDPLDLSAINAIEEACGLRVEARIATESDVAAAIRRIYED